MNVRDDYFGPMLVLLSAAMIVAAIGLFLLTASGTPWLIRLLGAWALAIAGFMGWTLVRELAD